MTVAVLTFTTSEKEISSGIPQSVSINSNVPATIYYTLDGTSPTTDSPIYIDTISFPTGINSLTLSAFGIDGDSVSGPILTQFFAPNTTKITVSRNVGAEGFVIDRFNMGEDNPTGFDSEGSPARFIDFDPNDLTILQSVRGFLGIGEGTSLKVNIPLPQDTPSFIDDNFQPFSTPEKAELFNPYAKLILIDNRLNNDINIMPRPWGSLSNVYKEFGGKRIRSSASDATYISGGFVRKFYDARNNVMVSYYYDNNENRYVKNIQTLPSNIPNIYIGGINMMPIVFKWIERGKQSSY